MNQQHHNIYTQLLANFWEDSTPKNFIEGTWQDTSSRIESIDPSTGHPYTSVPDTSADEVDIAVSAAQQAQLSWKQLTMSERAEYLAALHREIKKYGEELSYLESIDSGNPLPSTKRDIGLALRYLTEWPGRAIASSGKFTRPHRDGFSLVSREPYGVVGRIIAYNHPILFAIAGLIYPLMAGNSIVIKTADQTPVATLALGHLLKRSLPDGLVNIVSGGVTPGDRLVTHPEVKRIAFVGSDKTALAIQGRLSSSGIVKHFTAELGGKNPFIIFDDSDIEAAAEAAFQGLSFTVSAGQSCQSTAKILVQESVRQQVEKYLTKRMQNLCLGSAYEHATEMGPIVSASQTSQILDLINAGNKEGATLVTGGKRINSAGYFIEPTLFSEVTPEMTIYNKEIFGPVATITSFSDVDTAIKLANDTQYGLSAAVWTNDLNRALSVSSQIDAGYIWINDANRHYPGAPFGGMKSSGVGREESIDELYSYTEGKSINIKVSE